ncbi:TniQ family protein [Pseudomonas sp. LB3P14]
MNVLSFVARPFYMESPTSILIRTAKFNGYRDVWDMCLALGISQSSYPRDIRLRDHPLCNLLCNEAPCLANALRQVFFEHPASQHLHGSHIIVNNHDVFTRSLRCQFLSCPMCLKLGYSRVPQDFTFFDFCPAHNVLLTSVCPNCGHINQWKKICGFTCKCGFNLADAEVLPYRHRYSITLPSIFAVQDASRFINDYLYTEAQKINLAAPYLIESTSTQELHAQIQTALQVDLSTNRQLPLSVFESIWLTVKDPIVRRFAIDYLQKNHQASGPCDKQHCCATIKLTFSQLRHAIRASARTTRLFINEMSITGSPFPVTNTIGYSHPNLCAVIQAGLELGRQHNASQQKEHCSLAEAAFLLHTSHTSMQHAVKRGFFPNTVTGNRVTFIPNTSVQEFKTRFVFYSEIADSLGISGRTLNRIASQLGLIPACDRNRYEAAIYLRNSVNFARMREQLKQVRRGKSQRSSAIEEVRTLAQQFDLSVMVLNSILRSYCGCNTPSKELLPFQRLALHQWLSTHITLKAASKLLNTNVPMLNTRFIKTNLVQKIDICKIRFIAAEDIKFMDAHLKKYMSRIDAGRFLCVSDSVVIKLVKQGKLKHTLLKTSTGRTQILIEI